MDRPSTTATTKNVKRSVKPLNDKKSPTNQNSSDLNPRTEVEVINETDYSTVASLNDSIDKKLNSFISKVQNDRVRENCFKKLDDHVNGLLDTVKIREKKRKNAKASPETNGLDKIDLTTPDSILTQINLKNVFNISTFSSLPLYYQYKLIKLLPKCDQQQTAEGWLNLNPSALNNEYFTKAYQYWLKQLKESKFNSDFVQKCKADLEKEKQKLDPFKVENFEPIWNEPLSSRENYDELLEIERQTKLNLKKAKADEHRHQNELNMKLVVSLVDNTANQTKGNQTKSRRRGVTKQSANRQTPIKDQLNNNQPNQANLNLSTSPLSIGSITVRKTLNPSPPVSSNDQSPTNGKLFYISNNGKLLQLQQTIPQQNLQFDLSPRQPAVPNSHHQQSPQNELISGRKRKIDLDDNLVIVNKSPIQHSTAIHQRIVTNQSHINSYLSSSAACDCQRKALVNCSQCRAFCHSDCVNSSNICDNCLQANSNLLVR